MADQLSTLTVEVKTTGAQESKRSLQDMAQKSVKAETAAKQYRQEADRVARSLKSVTTAQNSTNQSLKTASSVYQENRGGFRAMRGATQQLSYQLQDVAVQAQMGTDSLKILAQQGPQIASIFGPKGAILGAIIAFSALIGGTLADAIFGAEEKVEDLDEALRRLNVTSEESIGVFKALGDEFDRYSQSSIAVTTSVAAREIQKAQRIIDASADTITESITSVLQSFDLAPSAIAGRSFKIVEDQLKQFGESIDDFLGTTYQYKPAFTFIQDQVQKLQKSLGLSSEEAFNFLKQISEFKNTRSAESMQALNVRMAELSEATGHTNQELLDLTGILDINATAARRAQGAIDLFNKVIDAGTVTPFLETEQERQRVKAESLKKLLDQERAYTSRQLQDEIKHQQRLGELQDKAAAQQLDREQRIQWQLNKDQEKNEAKRAQIIENSQKVLSELYTTQSPAYLAFMNQQERMKTALDDRLREQASFQETYDAAIRQLEVDRTNFIENEEKKREMAATQAASRMLQAEADRMYNQMSLLEKWAVNTRMAIDNIEARQLMMAISFEQSMAQAFEGILTGTMNAKEAFLEFTRAMLRSFLGAIAEMIAKRIALATVEKIIGKSTAFAASTYMALTAQAQALQAGLAAFASTAAIPVVGPAAAPEAMASALAVANPIANAIGALSLAAAGSRATGGQVRGGESYLVGERGPELLTMGGSGRISSNDQLKQALGGGGGITIINNVDARGADASVDQKIRLAMKQTSESTTRNIQNLMKRRRFV
jgi:hypothetical protein